MIKYIGNKEKKFGERRKDKMNIKNFDLTYCPEKLREFACKTACEHSGVFSDDKRYIVFPGFCDVHVHFREPGFSYKETIKTGTDAALHGGYTAVCTMPNLKPVPDSKENLDKQLELIKADGRIRVLPYASITVGELGERLSGMDELAKYVPGFSDDGRGVQSDDMMRSAMIKAKALGKPIVAHCEVNSLLKGGYIHDGEYAERNGHAGICSESEWGQIKRDIELVKEIGCAYHVCHISTKESVELIRRAKAEGVNITCETAPHYLILDDSCLKEEGRFKMNPPLRAKEDREALVAGIIDGTIDMIATDHAPHSFEEKSKGLKGSPFGVVGLESSFRVMYTHFVKNGVISMEKLLELLVYAPRKRFGIPLGNEITVWDLDEELEEDPETYKSMGRATPFEGMRFFGKNILTAAEI